MRIKTFAAVTVACLGLAIPATAGAKTLIGSGSVAAEPVFRALFKAYTKIHPKIHFIYTANGGNAGVKDVQNGTSMFAGQARPPLPSDAGTIYVKMYLDGLCIDVNSANGVGNASISTLRSIYKQGPSITNWSNVPGSNLSTTIDPVGRDTNGGTYNFFLQAVLNNNPPGSQVNALTSDGLVVNAVKQDHSAIGYAGLAWQSGGALKKIKVNGIPCSPRKIKRLRYPLSRFIWTVLPQDHPSLAVEKWIDWARRSHRAGRIIQRAHGVPYFNKGF